MKYLPFLIILCFSAISTNAQKFNKSVNKDSLFRALLKNAPEDKKSEFLQAYETGNDATKEFALFVLMMPRSSKNELIKNIDTNYRKIELLKNQYQQLVPKGFVVSIEFNSPDKFLDTKETIDLRILQQSGIEKKVFQEWNLEYDSQKLQKMLVMLKWTKTTLNNIKKLIKDANCISVENGEITTIGFARSGLGKYSYMLFNKDLEPDNIKKYNDGCEHIFYKKNIVLVYGGGATGSQCFPD